MPIAKGYVAMKPDTSVESVVVYVDEDDNNRIISIRSAHGVRLSLPANTVLVPFTGLFMVTPEYDDCLKITTSDESKGYLHLPKGFDHTVFMSA